MSEAQTIARPYVQAAFEVAQSMNDLPGWSALLANLTDLLANPEAHAVVTSPRVKQGQLESLILEIAGKLNKQQSNFVRVLIESGRLPVVAEIAEMFEALRAEAEKTVQVTVSSALELNDAQQQKITSALKNRFGLEIKLNCVVDKSLLGGVVIRMGDKVLDGSANTRLAELAYALA